ncbi:MAG: metallophosphoesterase [Actinomycetota bacterium]|nr:metallophosphoesterase [Actinomycetota bacterium]
MRVTQITDTHLSARRPYALHNWDVLLHHLDGSRPELVVHSGDLVLDDPDDDDLRFALAQQARLPGPWRAVPGNHDIGEPGLAPGDERAVTNARLARWRRAWGHDHWAVDLGSWRVVGLNAMVLGSGLTAEWAQDRWLDEQLASAADEGRHVALFLHKPLFLHRVHDPQARRETVLPEPRDRLLERIVGGPVRLVGSGHLHQRRSVVWRDVAFVWCPASGYVREAGRTSSFDGVREVGCAEYELWPDGTVSWGFTRVPGMVDVDVEPVVARYGRLSAAPAVTVTATAG